MSDEATTSVFGGQQWTTASGSNWNVVIEPDFVNQISELASHLALSSKEARAASEGFVELAQQASTKEGKQGVIAALFESIKKNGINQGAEARDLEGFTNLVLTLLNTTEGIEEKEREEYLQQLADALANGPKNEGVNTLSARYNSISSIFNSLPSSATATLRSNVLLRLFELAVSRDDLSVLSSALVSLPRWVSSEWGVESTSQGDAIISSYVEALEKSAEPVGETVRKLLSEYANDQTDEKLKNKLLLYTLASSSEFDVESLPSGGSDAALNKLRQLFISGSVADFDSSVGSLTLPAELEKEKLREKLQYVILADYCSSRIGQVISYEEVAKVLSIANEGDEEDRAMEVEGWVIWTIRVKLLTARLHQPSNTISILRASPRTFGTPQWELLQSRLEGWKSSIGNILDVVGRVVPRQQTHQQQTTSGTSSQDAQALLSAAESQQAVVEVA